MRHSLLILLLLSSTILSAQVKPVVKDSYSPATSAIIREKVGEKLQASYNNRILAQDIDKLIDPFTRHDEHSCWQASSGANGLPRQYWHTGIIRHPN